MLTLTETRVPAHLVALFPEQIWALLIFEVRCWCMWGQHERPHVGMVYWEAAYLWSNLDTTEPSAVTTSAITFVSQPLLHHEKEKHRKESPGLCPGIHK